MSQATAVVIGRTLYSGLRTGFIQGVLKVVEWIRIRELARKGVSLSEIARMTGRDRKTVRKVLEEEGPKLERAVS
jgi:DNA invertase Pin-like site-specific DNA recombinase